MITTNGRVFIKRFLAGQAGALVGAISVGIGDAAEALSDEALEFEFARVPVIVTDYDFLTDRLVFKGTLDDTVEGNIYEIGVWTSEVNPSPDSQEALLLTSFDSETEDWDVATFTSGTTRIGADSLSLSPGASASAAALLTGISVDLGDFSSQDTFVLAFDVADNNCAEVAVRLRTDAANYYELSVATPAPGFHFESFQKGAAGVVGSPTWLDITEIEVVVTATGGGGTTVSLEGLRIEDMDSSTTDYGLVARYVPASPVVKEAGKVQDIEYAMAVSVS